MGGGAQTMCTVEGVVIGGVEEEGEEGEEGSGRLILGEGKVFGLSLREKKNKTHPRMCTENETRNHETFRTFFF